MILFNSNIEVLIIVSASEKIQFLENAPTYRKNFVDVDERATQLC
jgi:hypothetical protein